MNFLTLIPLIAGIAMRLPHAVTDVEAVVKKVEADPDLSAKIADVENGLVQVIKDVAGATD